MPGTSLALMSMDCAVSLISHGHGRQVYLLVKRLAGLSNPALVRVVVTLNIPEPDLQAMLAVLECSFKLVVIVNDRPQGFGSNHNAAFRRCDEASFCVLNPDVGIIEDPFTALCCALTTPRAGCAYPVQVSERGVVQDSVRELPSFPALVRRYAGVQQQQPVRPEWATGAVLCFSSAAYRTIGGFDERYFMYCEDIDVCIRLQLHGFRLLPARVSVVHVASRASHRNAQHFIWHARSLLRLWSSRAYWQYVRGFRARASAGTAP